MKRAAIQPKGFCGWVHLVPCIRETDKKLLSRRTTFKELTFQVVSEPKTHAHSGVPCRSKGIYYAVNYIPPINQTNQYFHSSKTEMNKFWF
jgi:hypothetical protein